MYADSAPGRVLEDVAEDHSRRVGAGVAGADEGGDHRVLVGQSPQLRQDPGLGSRGGKRQGLVGADRLGNGLVDQLIEGGHAEDGEHALHVLRARAEVAISK